MKSHCIHIFGVKIKDIFYRSVNITWFNSFQEQQKPYAQKVEKTKDVIACRGARALRTPKFLWKRAEMGNAKTLRVF